MIPRVGRQGTSFKGAAQYYLHDKRATTAERVAHVETRNLPTQDPEVGWRLMMATAKDSDRLKRDAGVYRGGAKLKKPVFHLSLSWHPDQNPDRAHMVDTMDSALAALGLTNNQAIYVIHNDEPHPHIHVLANRVDPETGRSAVLAFSKRRLSQWAEEYERTHGVYCERRISNNEKRARNSERDAASQPSRKRDQRARSKELLKEELMRRYRAADSGQAFQAAVKELGYEIAQGRRIVLVGPGGNETSLSRHLDGVTAAALRKMLKDVPLRSPEDIRSEGANGGHGKGTSTRAPQESGTPARTQRAPRRRSSRQQMVERDAQTAGQDSRIEDAGIDHQKAVVRTGLENRLQDAQLDRWGAFYEAAEQQRHRLDAAFERQYGAHERRLRRSIEKRERTIADQSIKSRISRLFTRQHEQLENDRRTLASIDQRKAEARAALTVDVEQRREGIERAMALERAHAQRRDLRPREVDEHARSIERQERSAEEAHRREPDRSHVPVPRGDFERERAAYLAGLAGIARNEPDASGNEDNTARHPAAAPRQQEAGIQQTSVTDAWTAAARGPGAYEGERAAYHRAVENGRNPGPAHERAPEHDAGS